MRPTWLLPLPLFIVFILSGADCNLPHHTSNQSKTKIIPEQTPPKSIATAPAIPGAGPAWLVAPPAPLTPQDPNGLAQLNAYRTKKGLPPLIWHNGLGAVALMHNQDMSANNYLALVSQSGIDMDTMAHSATPPMTMGLTTYAVGGGTGQGVNSNGGGNSWLNFLQLSPVTTAMLNNPAYTQVGYAFTINPNYRRTIIFGQGVVP